MGRRVLRGRRWAPAFLAAAVLASLGDAAAGGHARAAGFATAMPGQARAVAADAAQAASRIAAPTYVTPASAVPAPLATAGAPVPHPQPLVSDFDGDHRRDVLWYGPGPLPDHVWYADGTPSWTGRRISLTHTYQPLLGDFDGDHRGDVLWYAPGTVTDPAWYGGAAKSFWSHTFKVDGTYRPFVGDFDGDGRSDIFWYAPGAAGDTVWYGAGRGLFSPHVVHAGGSYQPVVGDFNGDHASDIIWYSPTGSGAIWFGSRARVFSSHPRSVVGAFTPIVGDFDGDHVSDVVWYSGQSRGTRVWYGTRTGAFAGYALAPPANALPRTGDFDGDGRADLLWYVPGVAKDYVWYAGARGRFASYPIAVSATYDPQVGDFNGDGRADVLWWAPGTATDSIWWSRGRGFTPRPTTIDLEYARAPVLDPAVWRTDYAGAAMMAHEFGGINGTYLTSSPEAFERNYARGFRVFECDLSRLADGSVFLAHDHAEWHFGLSQPFSTLTRTQVAGRKFDGTYTGIFAEDAVQLLVSHPDAYLVLDPKGPNRAGTELAFMRIAMKAGVMNRVLPHIAYRSELDALRRYYPLQNYILALYWSQYAGNFFDDPQVLQFVASNRTPAVMMFAAARDPSLPLTKNRGRRYRPAFAQALQGLDAVVYVHSVLDEGLAAYFQSVGVGIYSDDPYPPYTAAPVPPKSVSADADEDEIP